MSIYTKHMGKFTKFVRNILFLICIQLFTSCSTISLSISICATGEYEDHIEYHLDNIEYQRIYGLRWDSGQKRIYFGEDPWHDYKTPADSRISTGD